MYFELYRDYSQVPLRLGLGSFLTLHGARSPIAIEDNLLLPARRSYESSLTLLMFEVLELRPNVLGMQVLYFPIEPASPYVLMTIDVIESLSDASDFTLF
jgi:hypothetical protein